VKQEFRKSRHADESVIGMGGCGSSTILKRAETEFWYTDILDESRVNRVIERNGTERS